MKSYRVEYEKTDTGYSAYVPDLPGCVAAAQTLDETRDLILEAIALHINELALTSYFAIASAPLPIYTYRETEDSNDFVLAMPALPTIVVQPPALNIG
jgi:predicted RNase H-like HicB family nuclease